MFSDKSWVMARWVSTQSPVSLTCVTTDNAKEYRTPEFTISFRTISDRLFWGFVEEQTRYSKYRIAELSLVGDQRTVSTELQQ
jgi:hypothetical protein